MKRSKEQLELIVNLTPGIEIIEKLDLPEKNAIIWYVLSKQNNYSFWDGYSNKEGNDFFYWANKNRITENKPLLELMMNIHKKMQIGDYHFSDQIGAHFPNLDGTIFGSVFGEFYATPTTSNKEKPKVVTKFRIHQILDEKLLPFIKKQTSESMQTGFKVDLHELEEMENLLSPKTLKETLLENGYQEVSISGLKYCEEELMFNPKKIIKDSSYLLAGEKLPEKKII